jgi:hypothetical protein
LDFSLAKWLEPQSHGILLSHETKLSELSRRSVQYRIQFKKEVCWNLNAEMMLVDRRKKAKRLGMANLSRRHRGNHDRRIKHDVCRHGSTSPLMTAH